MADAPSQISSRGNFLGASVKSSKMQRCAGDGGKSKVVMRSAARTVVVFPHAPVITNLSAVSDNAHLEELNAVPRADGSQYLTRRRVARNSGDHSSDGPRVRSGAGDGSYLREDQRRPLSFEEVENFSL